MVNWQCIKHCGACCYLEPSERPELDEYLTQEELDLYLSLVGDDGWCINFDHQTRKCLIYEQRPGFCRVTLESFQRMYGVNSSEFNQFAINCCHEQIESLYGYKSKEMKAYKNQVG